MLNLTADDAAKLKQALVLGKSAPAAGEAEVERLAGLALAAQRSRFTRRAPPGIAAGERVLPDDPRPVLGDAARSLAMQLFAGKTGSVDDAIARETARVLKGHGLRLHPFDLSRLEAFVAKHADELGAFEHAWLRLVRPAKERDVYADETAHVTEESFASAGLAAKLAFLRSIRAEDPVRARRIIESAFPNEAAPARADMLAVLGVGLTRADQPFLDSLVGDRAKSVKDAAEQLLARLPGHAAYAKRLADALALFEVKATGLLRRKATIELKLGSGVKPHQAQDLVTAKLEGLHLADLASGLGISAERFIEAGSENANLARPLLATTMQERRFDLADRLSTALDEPDDRTLLATLGSQLPTMMPDDRVSAARALVQPKRWKTFPSSVWWQHLHAGLAGPLPAESAEAILGAKIWHSLTSDLAESDDRAMADLIAAFGALVPAQSSTRFLAAIEPLPMMIKQRAATYHQLLTLLASSAAE